MTTAYASPASIVLTPEYLTEHDRVIDELRTQDPVHWVPGLDFWLVSRYDDVRRLLTDPSCTHDTRAWERYEASPPGTWRAAMEEHSLRFARPREHARLRRLVSAALTPRAVKRMESQVREVVEQFGAPLRGRAGVIDLIDEFTNPIPNAVISEPAPRSCALGNGEAA